MAFIKRDAQYHNYGDYLIWSRTSGDELIDGVAYVREPPSPSLTHQVIAMEVGRQLQNSLEGTPWEVFIAPFDVRFPKSTERDEDVDTVVQPDVLITRDLRKLDSRGMRGAPDWLAEVLSPGTARHDRSKKIPVYERAGVQEVWLVDFAKRTVAIYRLCGDRYGPPTTVALEGDTPLGVVPGAVIRWDPIVARIRRGQSEW